MNERQAYVAVVPPMPSNHLFLRPRSHGNSLASMSVKRAAALPPSRRHTASDLNTAVTRLKQSTKPTNSAEASLPVASYYYTSTFPSLYAMFGGDITKPDRRPASGKHKVEARHWNTSSKIDKTDCNGEHQTSIKPEEKQEKDITNEKVNKTIHIKNCSEKGNRSRNFYEQETLEIHKPTDTSKLFLLSKKEMNNKENSNTFAATGKSRNRSASLTNLTRPSEERPFVRPRYRSGSAYTSISTTNFLDNEPPGPKSTGRKKKAPHHTNIFPAALVKPKTPATDYDCSQRLVTSLIQEKEKIVKRFNQNKSMSFAQFYSSHLNENEFTEPKQFQKKHLNCNAKNSSYISLNSEKVKLEKQKEAQKSVSIACKEQRPETVATFLKAIDQTDQSEQTAKTKATAQVSESRPKTSSSGTTQPRDNPDSLKNNLAGKSTFLLKSDSTIVSPKHHQNVVMKSNLVNHLYSCNRTPHPTTTFLSSEQLIMRESIEKVQRWMKTLPKHFDAINNVLPPVTQDY